MTAAIQDLIGRVRGALSQGRIADAQALLGNRAAHDDAPADVLALAALVERHKGDLTTARVFLEKAVARPDAGSRHFNQLGNVLAKLADAAAADSAFATAIEREPDQADAWINRGNLLIESDNSEAIRLLEHATRLAPGSVLAWNGLGAARRFGGDCDGALAAFEAARRLDPLRATTLLQLGITHMAADDPRAAISVYDEAERCGALVPEHLDNRAAARLEYGDIEGACRDYDRLVEAAPHYAPGHLARARLYTEYGLEGDAFSSFRMRVQGRPEDRGAWLAWLAALATHRRFAELGETAQAAFARFPDDRDIRLFRALSASEQGEIARASAEFAALDEGLAADPDYLAAHARHALRAAAPDLAERLCERLLRIDPDNQLAWAYRGLAWRVLGDARDAWLNDYDRLVSVQDAAPREGGDAAAFAAAMAPHLRDLHRSRTHPADQSLRGGTQTAGALFSRRPPWIGDIQAAARRAVGRFVADLPDDRSHPFLARKGAGIRFSGSWSVRLQRAGFHIAHIHPQGWISSAFYFVVPDGAGEADPHAGWLQLGAPPEELGLDLGPVRLIKPEPGTLALFPSYMWHGTVPFTQAGERLTCAFDVLPTARAGIAGVAIPGSA